MLLLSFAVRDGIRDNINANITSLEQQNRVKIFLNDCNGCKI